MNATAEKVHKVPFTADELIRQINDDVASRAGDLTEAASLLAKAVTNRHKHLLLDVCELAIGNWEPRATSKAKSVPTEAEKIARGLELQARRVRQAAQVDQAAEKRVIMRLAANATQHDLWKLGHKYGKRNGRKLIWGLFSAEELADAGIVKA